MTNLAVGGVPEHFNLPWLKVVESGVLADVGVDLRWEEYPGGTGAMSTALNDGRLDVAMLLTEGAVAAIANGGTFRIVSLYTETPLLWGIHVPPDSRYAIDDLRDARYAVSRPGSGSHLMAFALARQRGWPVEALEFETVGGVDGALDAFEKGRADVFLWEKFMTQPLVDAGRFRRIGEFAAPWPAFVVCVSVVALVDKRDAVSAALQRVFAAASEVAGSASAAGEISRRYGLRRRDAEEWLGITRWASGIRPADSPAASALATLRDVGVLASGGAPAMTAAL